jgi:hypothetical protein
MDGQRFDLVAKALAESADRRTVVRALLAALGGAGLATRLDEADARDRPKKVAMCRRGRTVQVPENQVEKRLARGFIVKIDCCSASECDGAECVDGACEGGGALPPGSPCNPAVDICQDGLCIPLEEGSSKGLCCTPTGTRPAVCDGVCTDLAEDPNNCAQCGRVCREGVPCSFSFCCNGRGGFCRSDFECCGFDDRCVSDRCCSLEGTSCSVADDCCSGRCESGVCACAGATETCSVETDCCGRDDLSCTDGRCCAPSGGICGSDDQCCSGSCLDGLCAECEGGVCCRSIGSCTDGPDCCSGLCVDGSCTCIEPGNACSTDAECCGDAPCRGGVCCIAAPNTCSDNAQCCSGVCDPEFDICACARGGQTCADDGDCCELDCEGGVCACGGSGAFCVTDDECCSGLCRQPNCD